MVGKPYLSCPYCPSQTYPAKLQTRKELLRYMCILKHQMFILEEDPSFNYGHNHEQEERGTGK